LTPSRTELTRICGHTFLVAPLSPSSTVLDLGANQGAFARALHGRFGCRIHSVEPTPALALALEGTPGIQVHHAAVNAKGGELLFRIDPNNSESSSIVSEPDEHTTVVDGTTLDALAGSIGPIDLLKLDVEGAEVGILDQTSEATLRAIPQLTIEFHDFKPAAAISPAMVRSVLARLRGLGFDVFVNTLWTFGDVLCVNQQQIALTRAERRRIAVHGRWLPGLRRIAGRLAGRTEPEEGSSPA